MIVPNDVQEAPYAEPPRAHGAVHSSASATRRRASCRATRTCARAADVLNAGERVAMLIGAGARGAAEEVEQVADLLGCGVAKALNGRAVAPRRRCRTSPARSGCWGRSRRTT